MRAYIFCVQQSWELSQTQQNVIRGVCLWGEGGFSVCVCVCVCMCVCVEGGSWVCVCVCVCVGWVGCT